MNQESAPGRGGLECFDAAIEYGLAGRAVFPVGLDKAPLTAHGFKDATTRLARIAQLWTGRKGAGIGSPVPAGQFVLDVDPRHNGDETLAELVANQTPLPPTVMTRTGGGGRHFYFRLPANFDERRIRASIGRGLDIKAAGSGYTVLPPSPHESGGHYAWEPYCDPNSQAVAEAPSWLAELVKAEASQEGSYRQPVNPEEVLCGVPEGERDTKVFAFACYLRREWIPRNLAEPLVLMAARACRPPFPDLEALRKVEQAWKFPAGDRRTAAIAPATPEKAPEAGANAPGEPRASQDDLWVRPTAELRRRPGQVTLRTGLAPLDDLLGGGVRTGSVIVGQGAPDSGKSTLVDQMALRFGEQGAYVAILATDPGQPTALCRVGEQLVLDLGKLSRGDTEECDRLDTLLAERHIYVPDDTESFNSVLVRLKERAGNAPRVIVGDSLQRLRVSQENQEAESERLRISQGLDRIAAAVAADPLLLVLLTSEVSRGSYASKDPEKRTQALAAGAETRAIEYRAHVLLHLMGVEGLTTVEVAKNKQTGRRGRFRIQLRNAVFHVVDEAQAAEEDTQAEGRKRTDASAVAQARILTAFARLRMEMRQASPNGEASPISKRRLADKAGLNTERQDFKDALEALGPNAQKVLQPIERTNGTYFDEGPSYRTKG